jgi:hypothetical protein
MVNEPGHGGNECSEPRINVAPSILRDIIAQEISEELGLIVPTSFSFDHDGRIHASEATAIANRVLSRVSCLGS